MSVSLRVGASQLTFLFLALFLPLPQTVAPHPPLLSTDPPGLEAVLLNLRSTEEDPEVGAWPEGSWEELRVQRGLLMKPPLSPFLDKQQLNYQEGGDDGRTRSDALTSMAGGLQAVDREKGGFVFRFGKKRWMDESRGEGGGARDD